MQSNHKTYFCPKAYACMILKECAARKEESPFILPPGRWIRRCQRNGCSGAHNEEEMREKDFIKKFHRLNFSEFNLGPYYEAIYNVLNEAVGKVNDSSLASALGKLGTLNFVEMLQLWVKIYLWTSIEKKKGSKRLPRMSIDNPSKGIIEDHMWALERETKMCPKHAEINRKINSKEKFTPKDTCLGGFNCKHGCHNRSQLISIDDLLFGTDTDTFTHEMYTNKVDEINRSILDFEKKIKSMEESVKNLKASLAGKNQDSNSESKNLDYKTVVSRGSKNKNSKTLKKISDLEKKIAKFNKVIFFKRERELKKIPRMKRLTELGLEPICFYLERKKKLRDERMAKLESSQDVSKKSRRKVRKPKF